jgi:hypothetical protein
MQFFGYFPGNLEHDFYLQETISENFLHIVPQQGKMGKLMRRKKAQWKDKWVERRRGEGLKGEKCGKIGERREGQQKRRQITGGQVWEVHNWVEGRFCPGGSPVWY